MINKEITLGDFGASGEELHAELGAAGERSRAKARGNNNPPPIVRGTQEIHSAEIGRN